MPAGESTRTTLDARALARLLPAAAAWALAVVLVARFIAPLAFVALSFLAAAALAAALRPLAQRIPARRGVAGVLVSLGVLAVIAGLLAGLAWAIYSPLRSQLADWPQIRERLDTGLRSWSERLDLAQPLTIESLGAQLLSLFSRSGGADVLASTTSLATSGGLAVLLVAFGTVYMLTERPGGLTRPALDGVPPERRAPLARAAAELEPRLRWWVLGSLTSMGIVGVASWAGYSLIGLEFALPVAILAGLFEIVPTLGPILAGLVAAVIASTQGAGTLLGVAGVYAVVQTLESWVVTPIVMKRAVQIPPLVTLFTSIFWGMVLGAPGLILAVPINLVIWTVAEHVGPWSDDEAVPPPDPRLRAEDGRRPAGTAT